MKIKNLLAILLLVALCFTTAACGFSTSIPDDTSAIENEIDDTAADTNEEQEREVTPLLYKVTNDIGNTVWLFGSVHVGEEYFYPLPEYVTDAFEASESLAVEFDLVAFEKDLAAQTAAMTALVYTDGTKIDEHIPAELYDQAVEILEESGYYTSFLDYYIPSFWSSFIDSALYEELGVEDEYGVDRHMIALAYDAEKDVLDIESAEFQYNMMADFSEELQIMMLEESVEMYYAEETLEELDSLIELWAQGDAEGLDEYLNQKPLFTSVQEKQLYEEYNNALMVERNLSMTDYAEQALLTGDEIFICVGAAHIVGEGAMADLLAERGYTVEEIKG